MKVLWLAFVLALPIPFQSDIQPLPDNLPAVFGPQSIIPVDTAEDVPPLPDDVSPPSIIIEIDNF